MHNSWCTISYWQQQQSDTIFKPETPSCWNFSIFQSCQEQEGSLFFLPCECDEKSNLKSLSSTLWMKKKDIYCFPYNESSWWNKAKTTINLSSHALHFFTWPYIRGLSKFVFNCVICPAIGNWNTKKDFNLYLEKSPNINPIATVFIYGCQRWRP